MISKDLESKVITAINTSLASATVPFQVTGSWQPQATEDESTVAVVAVAIGTPDLPTFSSPEVKFSGSVVLDVRSELDRENGALVWFADKLCELFKSWQADTYQAAFTALDLPGLSIDEVSVIGGSSPQLDRSDRIISVSFQLTLSGTYR